MKQEKQKLFPFLNHHLMRTTFILYTIGRKIRENSTYKKIVFYKTGHTKHINIVVDHVLILFD